MKLLLVNKRKLFYLFLISLICSVIGVFVSRGFLQLITGLKEPYGILSAVGVVTGIVIVVCFVVFLRLKTQSINFSEKYKIVSAALRVLALILLFIIIGVFMSFLFGFLSVLIYNLLKNTLSIQQIMGVLNYVISLITVLILPLFVSVFWSEIKSKEGFWRTFVIGIQCNWRKYFKLLITIFILFALGIVISVVFHYASDTIFMKIVKAVLISFLGTIGLFITDRICESVKEGGKNEKELA